MNFNVGSWKSIFLFITVYTRALKNWWQHVTVFLLWSIFFCFGPFFYFVFLYSTQLTSLCVHIIYETNQIYIVVGFAFEFGKDTFEPNHVAYLCYFMILPQYFHTILALRESLSLIRLVKAFLKILTVFHRLERNSCLDSSNSAG